MSTTGEGDAVFYEGGGAGGKYPKRPTRRTKQMTPYDRPISSLRATATATAATNDHSGGWLTKLVVDPASKLISYGANRFFSSVFRKRLPAPPRQVPEANRELSGGFQGSVHENQSGGDEPARDNGSHLISSSVGGGISELEQLLKQKTFTSSEIERLTELLRSKAVQVPGSDDEKVADALPKPQTDVQSQQQYSSASLGKDKIEEDRSHIIVSTPIPGSKVLDHEIATPAELAKAYMGSRPSKLSPSMLGTRNQSATEGSGLLSNVLFTPKPPITSFTMKNAVNCEVRQYGSVTPRSRGRSAIYNMARSPYSRVYPTDMQKGTGSTNGYGGPSSLSPLAVDHYGQLGPNKSTLKRGSSVLDDDLGSIGPVRRIRQKSSLLSHRSPLATHGVKIGSDVAQIPMKQKVPLENEPRQKVSKTVGENEKFSTPRTSYTPVPSKSSEVAARIFQHLEKLAPKEKSSGDKLAYGQEKSPSKMKPTKLQDGQKLEGWAIAALPSAHNSTSQKQREVEENGPKESVPTAAMHTKLSANTSRPIVETADSSLKTSASQPPQKRQAFEMRVHEDYLEQDDNEHSNGPAPQPLGNRIGPAVVAPSDGKPSSAEGKSGNTSIQLELKSASGPLSSKCTDIESSGVVVGKESTVFTSSASQEPSTSFQSILLPQSVSNVDKPKEVNTSPSFFSFGAKVDDRSPSFVISSSTSESSNRKLFPWAESKPENSSSSGNVLSTATGNQQIIAETRKETDQNTQSAGDTIRNSENVPSFSSNGSLVSGPPAFSFTASTTIPKMVPSSTAASSSSQFGSNVAPSSTIKFGISGDPSTTVSASTSNVSEPTGLQSKAENNTIFGGISNTSSSISSFVTGSGSNTFGLSSSLASSSTNGQSQGSLLGQAVSGFSVGTVSQSNPVQFGTSTSLLSFTSSSVGSEASSTPGIFGFSSSLASSSATNGFGSGNGPTSGPSKFVGDTSGVNAVSSTGATTSLPSFGASSSSFGTNTFGASSGPSFGIFSSTSTPSETVGNTSAANAVSSGSVATGLASFAASSSSSATSSASFGIFSFGASSSSSTPGTSASSSNSTSTTGLFTFGGNSSVSPIFSTSTSFSGFPFSASSSPATNTNPTVLNSSSGSGSSTSAFAFSAASSPVFGNPSSPFAMPTGNNNQTSPEDSMAVDTVQSSTPSLPVFGQPTISPSPPTVMFGSASTAQANPFQSTPQANPFQSTAQANPFQFGGQPSQVTPENPSPFQASTSLGGFSASGGFSLGSGGGGDKSSRKIVKVNRNRNRKK